MLPLIYCREKVQQSEWCFPVSFGLLSMKQREAITVLYAYHIELQELVENHRQLEVVQATLAWWRSDVEKIFLSVKPEHPVNQAWQALLPYVYFPKHELLELINGWEMDLHHFRYATFENLQYYCCRIGGTLSKLVAHILGVNHHTTLVYAEKMGEAWQLTQIVRDVGVAIREGRIYFPVEDLQRFNLTAQNFLSGQITPEWLDLMTFQWQRVQSIYHQAVVLLPAEDKRALKVHLMMVSVYYALLMEIKRDGIANLLRYKLRLPKPRQMRIAFKTRLLGFKPE